MVAFAAICVGVLSGCALVHQVSETGGSIVDRTLIDSGLRELKADLKQMPEVTSVTTSAELQANYGYDISVKVAAGALSETGALSIVRRATKTLNSERFAKQHCSLELTNAGGFSVSVLVFNLVERQLSSELAYAFAVKDVTHGKVTLSLYGIDPASASDAPYARSVDINAREAPIDWDALRSLTDNSAASKAWTLPGLSATDALPPNEVTNLVSQTTRILPALSDADPLPDPFFYVDWVGSTKTLTEGIQSKSFTEGESVQQTPAWPRVLAALALTAEIHSAVEFYYAGSDGKTSGGMHVNQCSGRDAAGANDRALFAAVEAAGVRLPVGAGPGLCVHP